MDCHNHAKGLPLNMGVQSDSLAGDLDPKVFEWRRRVQAEYRSAALTAQLLHRCIQLGLSDDLLATAQRIIADELDHARISAAVAVALGGSDEPVALSPADLCSPDRPEGPLADLVERTLQGFCLGETFAVPLFSRMRAGAESPAREALDRILRDEAIHRQFGWDLLDTLLQIDELSVRAFAAQRLPELLSRFQIGYQPDAPTVPLSPAEVAAGLIPLDAYRSAFEETMAEDIVPRFARRGIHIEISDSR